MTGGTLLVDHCNEIIINFIINSDIFIYNDKLNRDKRKLILTHIYLLIGCATPVWVYVELRCMSTK